MVPEVKAIDTSLVSVKQANLTYKLNGKGLIDNYEAMEQAILLILSIERYAFAIYSPDYGLELNELYGKPVSYVYPELKLRICEALLQDDRVQAVDDFSYSYAGGSLALSFQVTTDFGVVSARKEVRIA